MVGCIVANEKGFGAGVGISIPPAQLTEAQLINKS